MALAPPDELQSSQFDFSQAFFNIPIERRSKRYLSFKVAEVTYRFRVLPFGLGIAPFVCQTFLNAIIRYIRKWTPYAFGFIDDILIGSRSKKVLTRILQDLLLRFRRIKWKLNECKCVLIPTRKLVFLGSDWHGAGVTRQDRATTGVLALLEILEARNTPLVAKEKQVMAGFLNYYLQFSGKIHTIIQRLVETSGVDMARARFLARFLRSNLILFDFVRLLGESSQSMLMRHR